MRQAMVDLQAGQRDAQLPTELKSLSVQAWQELANTRFLSLQCQAEQPASFVCSMLVAEFADCLAADIAVGASTVVRRKRDVEDAQRAHFKVFWQLAGVSRIAQGVNQSILRPGMWSVYDTRREYLIESSEQSRFLTLILPQEEGCGWSPSVAALGGLAIDGNGAPRVVVAGLSAMLRDGTPLDAVSQQVLQDSTLVLLESALTREVKARALSLDVGRSQRLAQAQEWIRRQLGDPQLSPETIARTLGISRRTLYNLFVAGGTTPRAYIHESRMALASARLSDPAARWMQIADIARQCGFTDPAHFTRCFHAARGMSPSRWREQNGQ